MNNRADGGRGNGRRSTGTRQNWGGIGGNKGGTDWDGSEKERVGVVWARERKRQKTWEQLPR